MTPSCKSPNIAKCSDKGATVETCLAFRVEGTFCPGRQTNQFEIARNSEVTEKWQNKVILSLVLFAAVSGGVT